MAQGPAQPPTNFAGSTSNQIVGVTQNGPGIPNPSVATPPPTAVLGEATSTTGSTAGVIGQSAGPFGLGVVGLATGTPTGNENPSGVVGWATATSGKTRGLTAISDSPGGTAGNFESHNGADLIQAASGPMGSEISKFTVDSSGNVSIAGNVSVQAGVTINGPVSALSGVSVDNISVNNITGPSGSLAITGNASISGDLNVFGTKSSLAKLSDGRTVALYAVEAPDNWFEDFGSGRLQSGVAKVMIDRAYQQTVNTQVAYHVFLTPDADCRGLYVAEKTPAGFEVRELEGGKSNIAFDYRIVAKRRGFESVRLEEVRPRQPAEQQSHP
jgi:hypothetical protein